MRCFEAKIEESEKAGSHQESNPGYLACAANAELRQPDNHQSSQSSIYTAQVVLKRLSLTPSSHSVCAVRTSAQVRCRGFDSQRLSAFLISSIFASKHLISLYFNVHEARVLIKQNNQFLHNIWSQDLHYTGHYLEVTW